MTLRLSKLPATLREVEKNHFYTLDYPYDYKLSAFMQSGARSDKQLEQFISKELLEGIPLPFHLNDAGCSTFAGALENGEYILGRNFDVDPCPSVLVRTRPADGYASLSMVNLHYLGLPYDKLPLTDASTPYLLAAPYKPLDGINEKGLAIAVLSAKDHVTCQQTGKIGLTTTSAIRVALDNCATAQEVIELWSQFDMYPSRGSNYHFHLRDLTGESVVIEYANGEMQVIRTAYVTNFFLTPGIDKTGCGRNRYEILEKTVNETGGVFRDEAHAMELLGAVAEGGTRWSQVFNLPKRAITMALEHSYEKTYTFFLDQDIL